MRDHTGELCPKCKKGKLFPTSKVIIEEPANKPIVGLTRNEDRQYECDYCHERHGYGQTDLVGMIDDTEPQKNKETNNKKL